MDEELQPTDVEPTPPPDNAPVKPKGRPIVAWVIILLLVGWTTFLVNRPLSPSAAEEAMPEVMEGAGKVYVGISTLPNYQRESLYKEIQQFNFGPLQFRLRYITLAGELRGPVTAQEELKKLARQLAEHQHTPAKDQQRAMQLLEQLYADYAEQQWSAPSLSEQDKAFLQQELDWFGRLALAPAKKDSSQAREEVLAESRTALAVAGGIIGFMLLVSFLGFIGLCYLIAVLVKGKMAYGLALREPPGGLYAESFACWMVLFLGLNLLVGVIFRQLGVKDPPLAVGGLLMIFSAAAVFWPVLRGIPLSQVLHDVGLRPAGKWRTELLWGLIAYGLTLPLAFVGFLITSRLIEWQTTGGGDPFTQPPTPSHPVIRMFVDANWWKLTQVFVMASVIAPLVEETMFRGVLYRHLREATGQFGFALSVGGSVAITSLIFAVIHPQGWATVPALAALAVGFNITREIRQSIFPCMIAHGIHNGLLMLLASQMI